MGGGAWANLFLHVDPNILGVEAYCSMLIDPIRLPVKKVPLATDQAQGKACLDQITSFNKQIRSIYTHISELQRMDAYTRLPDYPNSILFVQAILEPPMVHRHLKTCQCTIQANHSWNFPKYLVVNLLGTNISNTPRKLKAPAIKHHCCSRQNFPTLKSQGLQCVCLNIL